MKAYDFEYDGVTLSSLGFLICHFDSLGVETVSMGSEINFNTVSSQNGARHHLTSATFEDCITATLQICKNLCDDSSMTIDLETQRDIMRWLNRRKYNKLKFIDHDGEYSGIFFEASFNVSKIEVGGVVVGFELEMFTNRPHALAESVTVALNVEAGEIINIYNKSDLAGSIYPNLEIIIKEDGDFKMKNLFDGRETVIKNCTSQEVITIEYPMISSSIGSGRKTKIQNDFNWVYPRLNSVFKNRLNEIEVSIKSEIKLTYSPIVKIGI